LRADVGREFLPALQAVVENFQPARWRQAGNRPGGRLRDDAGKASETRCKFHRAQTPRLPFTWKAGIHRSHRHVGRKQMPKHPRRSLRRTRHLFANPHHLWFLARNLSRLRLAKRKRSTHIDRIVQAYERFEDAPGFTRIVPLEEIRARTAISASRSTSDLLRKREPAPPPVSGGGGRLVCLDAKAHGLFARLSPDCSPVVVRWQARPRIAG
jgi:hypothetical protein